VKKQLHWAILPISISILFTSSLSARDTVSFAAADIDGGQSIGPEVRGALNLPDGSGPFPAVVLLPHCHGFQSRNVQNDWPDVLNENGYATLTVDSFGPQGQDTCEGLPRAESRTKQATYAVGALNFLASRNDIDPKSIGVMGFSEGAFVINNMIAPASSQRGWSNKFSAAVSAYGGCRRLNLHKPEDVPIMILAPEYDKRLVGLCISTAAASSHIHLHVLEGAYHGFDNSNMSGTKTDNAGNQMSYSSSATSDAQKFTVQFFDAHIGKNRGQKLERNVMLGPDQANEALRQWVSSNSARLCALDTEDFAEALMDIVEEWVDDKKVVPEMTVSKFKAKFMRRKSC